ncbi:tRNA (adenosine(37)-N6)-threonylcarbamoyltransferase complex transferase subunit TsaD [candidate division WWE3 bacterium CG08_land_8_20_14_0_20_41_10]|uniref:tRNA N6-adenosine threonylcarbamoyltransferase n=1 Tax=candidate division WWE3 bacterium CG08_land_8_20_14_0_20_41_10 TaxID=1975085 RepID=A0A2H0XDS1_UNCKA|nr:MAG: tRNA (adenosine(37)-N6)-threonylcarbamoyltransferase complex transferase subunit TsaD [candidate division WWE3 bacterium CG08_land_8_20_14_0_20_41_10]
MLILAIESSCDETACAVVENGVKEIASTIASSADFHHKTGGIVPEVAARKQVEFIVPVIESTIEKVADYRKIDAVAVTIGPGLAGSLIVGVEAAKALALAWNKPLIPVNHLVGHIYANFINNTTPNDQIFPAVVLIVSGGHTDLVLMKNHGDLEYLGGTVDDAAGEAFDKVARLLNLGMYLGGANLSKTAREYTGSALPEKLPRSFIYENNFDFSFSGLKTATKRLVDKNIYSVPAIAKEFEEAVIEVLVEKTLKAVKRTGARSILLGGGVSANQKLRKDLADKAKSQFNNIEVRIPLLNLCTDNAVYIASAAFFNQNYQPFDQVVPNPSLTINGGTCIPPSFPSSI